MDNHILRRVSAQGRTPDEAVENALRQIGLGRDDVDITIEDEGAKGFLGFGSRDAKASVREKDTCKARALAFLKGVTEKLGVDPEFVVVQGSDQISIEMSGSNMGVLIGHRGEMLDALQYLANIAANRSEELEGRHVRVLLDTEGYRMKREETLVTLARKMENRARRTGRRVVLEPMNPNERRVLHATLQDSPYVTTHSEGDAPNRRVVILPRRD